MYADHILNSHYISIDTIISNNGRIVKYTVLNNNNCSLIEYLEFLTFSSPVPVG